MTTKEIVLKMFSIIPDGLAQAGESNISRISFFTNIGIITGEINDDLVEMFVRFEQEVETKLGIPEKPDSKLRDGSFIALSNVIITQPSGCKMELSHFILFSDQIIGATLSDLELIPK